MQLKFPIDLRCLIGMRRLYPLVLKHDLNDMLNEGDHVFDDLGTSLAPAIEGSSPLLLHNDLAVVRPSSDEFDLSARNSCVVFSTRCLTCCLWY